MSINFIAKYGFMVCFLSMLVNCSSEPVLEDPVCTISYNDDLAYIFDVACSQVGCHHSNSTNGDLTIYNGVKNLVDDGSLWFRVLVTRDMPPVIKLDSTQLNAIKVWIEEGAKNN